MNTNLVLMDTPMTGEDHPAFAGEPFRNYPDCCYLCKAELTSSGLVFGRSTKPSMALSEAGVRATIAQLHTQAAKTAEKFAADVAFMERLATTLA